MRDFEFSTYSEAFIRRLRSAVATVPVIGDPAPTETIALAHYSSDSAITEFRCTHTFSWTNWVSDDRETIFKHIGFSGAEFRALYLIRLGTGSSYAPQMHGSSHMEEYRLDLPVLPGQFAMLKLAYVTAQACYEVI